MRERVWTDLASRHALQAIVSHGRGGAERAFDITAFQKIPLLRRFRPHAREAIGLKFHPHREFISGARILATQVPNLALDA